MQKTVFPQNLNLQSLDQIKSNEDLQLNELNRNREVSSRSSSLQSPAYVSKQAACSRNQLGLQYCLRNNQRSVPLGHAAGLPVHCSIIWAREDVNNCNATFQFWSGLEYLVFKQNQAI